MHLVDPSINHSISCDIRTGHTCNCGVTKHKGNNMTERDVRILRDTEEEEWVVSIDGQVVTIDNLYIPISLVCFC
jgi:hypothetical protein